MYAAHKGHLDIVKYLVEEYRANLKAKNKQLQSALDLCRPKYAEADYVDNRHAVVYDYLTQYEHTVARRDMFKVIVVTLIIPMLFVSLYVFVIDPYIRRKYRIDLLQWIVYQLRTFLLQQLAKL